MSQQAAPFGKRRPPSAPARTDPASEASLKPSLSVATNIGWSASKHEDAERVVPSSLGATVLAAAVIGVLHLLIGLHDGIALGEKLGPVTINGRHLDILPLILLGSLWAGGEAGVSSLFVVHGILRRLKRASFRDYGIGGGVFASAYAGLLWILGLGDPDQGWALAIATGVAAGLLYRLFAGAAPVD
jgi:hypothetical protein